jgi:hypothetical protein
MADPMLVAQGEHLLFLAALLHNFLHTPVNPKVVGPAHFSCPYLLQYPSIKWK